MDKEDKVIDYVFVSHPHNDHAGGIPEILENFTIKCIYMNCPWLYKSELIKIGGKDGRTTGNSLESELHDDFHFVDEIEKLAHKYNIKICEAFAGTRIEDGLFTILSPTKEFYLDMVIQSKKTKRLAVTSESYIGEQLAKNVKINFNTIESWDDETLGDENAKLDAENETSIILFGFGENDGMLLLGDAGTDALALADEQAIKQGILISDAVHFTEIPHHGGRHNVTTTVMDQMFGIPINEDGKKTRVAFVSVAEGSDHPRRVVVNAFLRRGFRVFKTNGNVRWYHRGDMPDRDDFSASTDELEFNDLVEGW